MGTGGQSRGLTDGVVCHQLSKVWQEMATSMEYAAKLPLEMMELFCGIPYGQCCDVCEWGGSGLEQFG